MTKARQFHRRKKPITNEEKIRRRAVFFGLLTIILSLALVIWGIPLFINLIEFLGDVRSENEQTEQVNIIPPQVPRLSYIPEATNSAQLDINGVTEPNATVKVEFNEEIIESKVSEEGEFKIEKLNLNSGKNQITVWAVDDDGNQSEKTPTHEVVYDTQPPELEIINPEDGATFEDEQTLEVKGKTEENARALVNDHVAIVGLEGEFIHNIVLQEGENEIIVVAEDMAGNSTEETLTVTYLP